MKQEDTPAEFDFFQEENESTRRLFNLEKVLDFQLHHRVEILQGADYSYLCYIDGNGYGTSLTPVGALTAGILQYEKYKS